MSSRVNVFIVDDSAVVRQVVTALLERDPDIEVVGSAPDPLFAEKKMRDQWPDVILLDIEMPRMDGITFLKKIMQERPTPVVICSTLTEKGAAASVDALAAGAVEVIPKPKVGLKDFLDRSAGQLARSIKAAARAKVGSVTARALLTAPREKGASIGETTDRIVAIGTSTGGTQALESVLRELPADCPGVVIVQHMPEKFTAAFADRLNRVCACEVKEATHGDRVLSGRALIAPGGRHMQVKPSGAQYMISIQDGPAVNRHKPSVDVLFRSVAKAAGTNAVGIIMTGMGNDGARGLLEMRRAGAATAAQDEASSVVFGMPKEAIALGGAAEVIPLSDIGAFAMKSRTGT